MCSTEKSERLRVEPSPVWMKSHEMSLHKTQLIPKPQTHNSAQNLIHPHWHLIKANKAAELLAAQQGEEVWSRPHGACQETSPLASYFLGSDQSTCNALATASQHPHSAEPGKSGQRDKAPFLQPVCAQRLAVHILHLSKTAIVVHEEQSPLPFTQNPKAWAYYMSDGMQKPCRCKVGTDSSHLHNSQGARGRSLPYSPAYKQAWLVMGSQLRRY